MAKSRSKQASQSRPEQVDRLVKVSVPLLPRTHVRLKGLAAIRNQTIGELAADFITAAVIKTGVRVEEPPSSDGANGKSSGAGEGGANSSSAEQASD
jgi:hypothetical protein